MTKRSNKDRALIALLEHKTIRDAATACGLSEETIYRYLRDPDFVNRYRDARRMTVEAAVSRMQAATGAAVAALERNLNCENPSVEVGTAQILIENAIKGVGCLTYSYR